MNSTATSSSATFNKSKIPTPQGNGVRKVTTSPGATKMTFDKGKNAGELKQRLASAVSAKMAAANREGRTANNNRGIGYLLQRKQQHDSKLNTKAISFQKPIRNNNGEAARNVDGTERTKSENNLRSGTNDLSKPSSQKFLLSALMSSRLASGSTGNTKQSGVAWPDRQKATVGAGRPTLTGSGNKVINPGKSSSNGTTINVGDKDSRAISSSLQKKKVEKPLFNSGVTSHGNGELDNGTVDRNVSLNINYDKEKVSLPTKTFPNHGMSRDKVGSKNLDVNSINGSQMAKKDDLLTKGASPNKQLHLSGNENRGNIGADATSKENSSLSTVIPGTSSTVSKKDHKFREDLLEKLEADVGSCKIATFQNMEDFSLLRMRIYRIRGDLEQLKKKRERRTPAVRVSR